MNVNSEIHYATGQLSNEFESNFIFIYLEQTPYHINKFLLKKKFETKEVKQNEDRFPSVISITM